MAFKDVLLTLTSYPEPTPNSVVESAVSIAAALGAHLAAVSCEVHVQLPGSFLSGSVPNISGIIAGEAEKSRQSARGLLAAFDAAAEKAGVPHETIVEKCRTFDVPELLVDYARQYSPHAQTVEKPGVRKLSDIKLMREDPEGVEKTADEVKTRYGKIFGV